MSAALTPEQIQWLLDHIHETKVPSTNISNAICLTAATASVILRYSARRLSKANLGKDDYCLFFAYMLYVSYVGVFWAKVPLGEGRHVILVTDPKAYALLSLTQASVYVFGMLFVKYSILFLYYRIFKGFIFRNVLFGIAAVIFSWAMAAFFASVFNCYPIPKSWNPSLPGKCIDYGVVTLIIGIFNVILDFVILAAPMPLLWRLQMSTRRKVMITGAFAVGCCACVVSIARLFYAKEASMNTTNVTSSNGVESSIPDPSWVNVWPGILSGLELCTGIVACCSITYRPLIEKFFGSSKVNSEQYSMTSAPGQRKIHVQQDFTVTESAKANLIQPTHGQEHIQN